MPIRLAWAGAGGGVCGAGGRRVRGVEAGAETEVEARARAKARGCQGCYG